MNLCPHTGLLMLSYNSSSNIKFDVFLNRLSNVYVLNHNTQISAQFYTWYEMFFFSNTRSSLFKYRKFSNIFLTSAVTQANASVTTFAGRTVTCVNNVRKSLHTCRVFELDKQLERSHTARFSLIRIGDVESECRCHAGLE